VLRTEPFSLFGCVLEYSKDSRSVGLSVIIIHISKYVLDFLGRSMAYLSVIVLTLRRSLLTE
jgi:hypothetical protein